jgi:hypothetical protein
MLKKTLAAATLFATMAGPAFADKAGDGGEAVEIGVLKCKVKDVTNVIFYTKQVFACEFDPSGDGANEWYEGEITKVGIDLSIKEDFTIIWAVFAPDNNAYAPKALTSTYVGAAADIAVGVGGGAAVLVGGGDNSFSLQPVSVSGVEGVGASIGLESFEIR